MALFGMTEYGWILKRLEDIKNDLVTAFRATLGYDIDTSTDSVAGNIIGLVADPIADLWEEGQNAYNSNFILTATGSSLDNLGGLLGISRLPAITTKVYALCNADDATTIPAGTVFSDNVSIAVSSINDVTVNAQTLGRIEFSISTYTAAYNYTIYINVGNGKEAYTFTGVTDADTTAAGLAALIDANSQVSASATNEVITIDLLDKYSSFSFELQGGETKITIDELWSIVPCENASYTAPYDPISGTYFIAVDTIDTIVTAVGGLNNVENPYSSDVGRGIETDAEYRARIIQNRRSGVVVTAEAIRTKILALAGVSSAKVYNDTINHTVQAVVEGGTIYDVCKVLYDNVAAGIETIGAESYVFTDGSGQDITYSFDRPADIDIYVEYSYTTLAEETFPSDGEDIIEATILSEGQKLTVGQDIVGQRFFGAIYAACPGIKDLTVYVGSSPAPVATYLSLDADEKPVFAAARIAKA